MMVRSVSFDLRSLRFGTWPKEYLLERRILSIYPNPPFRETRSIEIINGEGDVMNQPMGFLILISVTLWNLARKYMREFLNSF